MRRVYLRWIDWRRETVIRVEEGKWGMVRRRTTTPKVGRGGMMGGGGGGCGVESGARLVGEELRRARGVCDSG